MKMMIVDGDCDDECSFAIRDSPTFGCGWKTEAGWIEQGERGKFLFDVMWFRKKYF